MNSGDWIEHMSALEYANGAWSIYMHQQGAAHISDEAEAIAEEEDAIALI